MQLIELALINTDNRIIAGKSVSPAFLFAVFLWGPIKDNASQEEQNGLPAYVAYERAIYNVLAKQTIQLAIPRRLQVTIRDICFLQHRFTQRHGTRPFRVLEHPRFRAGYDLLMLRAESEETLKEIYEWWTAFHQADPTEQEKLLKEASKSRDAKRRKKTRHPSKKKLTNPNP